MAMYQVRFLKDVCNDMGHARSILQRMVQVEASCLDQAGAEACRLFCTRERVGHWRDHADRMEVDQVSWRMESSPKPKVRN